MDYRLNNDQPIQSENEDILGRNYFAKDLADIILHYTQSQDRRESLVIGLEGEWGSGKISLLNF